MKEFKVLLNCSICGEGFDTEYKLLKHMGADHPRPGKSGWMGSEDSCGCGSEQSHSNGHC